MDIKRIFIKKHLSAPLRYLYVHKIIKGLATGLIGFFVPLFLFKISGDIKLVIWYYLSIHIMSILFLPLTTKFLLRFDLKYSMGVSTIFIVLYLCILNHLEIVGVNIYWLASAVIIVNLYKLFYWVPYHTEFALFTEKHYRGRELGVLQAIILLLGIALPGIAGFIVVKFGFDWLFNAVLVLHLISVVPLFKIPKKKEKYSWGYFKTWQELFNKKNRRILLVYSGDGFQSMAGYALWPIFIFLLLDGEYLSVGIISTLIILVTVILQLLVGDLADHKNKKKILKAGSWMFSLGWLIKTFIETGLQIFVVGVYHGLSEVLMRTPLDTMTYDIMADKGHYIDEYTVLKEMALRVGKISVLVIALAIVNFTGLNWLFALVALVALLVNFI